MSSSVNPIGVNSQGIGNFGFGFRAKSKEEDTQKTNQKQQPSIQNNTVSANDVLSYMSQSASVHLPVATKTVNPTNYVDSESSVRIGEFINQFEDIVANNLSNIAKEFPRLSESASYAVAAKMAEASIS